MIDLPLRVDKFPASGLVIGWGLIDPIWYNIINLLNLWFSMSI